MRTFSKLMALTAVLALPSLLLSLVLTELTTQLTLAQTL